MSSFQVVYCTESDLCNVVHKCGVGMKTGHENLIIMPKAWKCPFSCPGEKFHLKFMPSFQPPPEKRPFMD
jgi:hypothetical protein